MALSCYDANGAPLSYYTQWDADQLLSVRGVEIDPIPVFYFAHRGDRMAIPVVPSVSGSSLIASVPNELLQLHHPIVVFINYPDSAGGRKTRYSLAIAVRQMPKPDDYIFTENVHYLKLVDIEKEIDALESRVDDLMLTATNNPNRLIYIGGDGTLQPIALGEGLKIKNINGIPTLTLTAVIVDPDTGESASVEVVATIVDGVEVLADNSGKIIAQISNNVEMASAPDDTVFVSIEGGIEIISAKEGVE